MGGLKVNNLKGSTAKVTPINTKGGLKTQNLYTDETPEADRAPSVRDDAYVRNIDVNKYQEYLPSGVYDNKGLMKSVAVSQPVSQKAWNAVSGTLLTIVPRVVGDIGAILDFEDYVNTDDEVGNWLTNATQEWTQYVNEDVAPIYRENPSDAFDWGDPGYWFQNGRMLAQSAIPFIVEGYLTGGVASGLFKGITQGTRFAKAIATGSSINKATRFSKFLTAGEKGFVQGMSGLTNAVMLNQAESIGSAMGVYDNTYKQLLDQGLPEEDARAKAADAAAYTVNMNRVNILLNLSSASMFIKNPWSTRALVNAPSVKNTFKKMAYEGAQEWAEETVNYVSEKAGTAKGLDKKYGWNEMIKDASSEHGLEAGFLGMIGGIVQTGGTIGTQHISNDLLKIGTKDSETDKYISRIKSQKQQYDRQQEEIKLLEEAYDDPSVLPKVTNVFNTAKELHEQAVEIKKAIDEENYDKVQELQQSTLAAQAKSHFEAGTTEKLLEFYKRIRDGEGTEKMDTDESSDYYYKKRAQEAISTIEKLEKEYVFAKEFVNVNDVYANRASKIFLENDLADLSTKSLGMTEDVDNRIQSLIRRRKASLDYYNKAAVKSRNEKGQFKDTKERLSYSVQSLLDPIDVRTLGKEAKTVYDKFLENIAKDPTVAMYLAIQQEIDSVKSRIENVENNYDKLTEPDLQKEIKSRVQKIENEIQEDLKKQKVEKRKQNSKADKSEKLNEVVSPETEPSPTGFSAAPEGPTSAPPSAMADDPSLSSTGRQNILKTKDSVTAENNPGASKDLSADETKQALSQAETDTESMTPPPVKVYSDSYSINNLDETNTAEESLLKEPETIEEVAEDGTVVYDYGRSTTAANKLAYKARDYNQVVATDDNGKVFVKREDFNNLLSNALMNKALIDPTKLQPGETITLRPKLDDDQEVPYEGAVVEYGSLPEELKRIKAPIVVEYDGEEIAFLHDVDWINHENLDGNVVEEQARLQQIRELVLQNGEVTTTISYTNNGKLLKTHDNSFLSVKDAMPDPDLTLAITNGGNFEVSRNREKNQKTDSEVEVLNENKPNGHLWALATVNKTAEGKDQAIAIPLRINKLKTAYVQSVVTAVKVFAYQNDKGDLGNLSRRLQQEFEEKTGMNLFAIADLRKYLNTFVYADFQADEGVKLIDYLKLPDTSSDLRMVNVNTQGVEWGRGKFKGSTLRNISATTINSELGRSTIQSLFDEFEKHLSQMYTHANLSLFDEQDFKLPLLTEDGVVEGHSGSYKDFLKQNTSSNVFSVNVGTDDNPKYAYTVQRTIEFDTSFVPGEKNPLFSKENNIKEVLEPSFPITPEEKENTSTTKLDDVSTEGTSDSDATIDQELNEKIQTVLTEKYPEIKLTVTNNPQWEEGENVLNQEDYDNRVKYNLKSVEILSSDKASQVFAKGKKNGWDLNKILTELQIPKEQKQIIRDKNLVNREEIITSLLVDNSFVVEVNVAKELEAPEDYKERDSDYYQKQIDNANKFYTVKEIDNKFEVWENDYDLNRNQSWGVRDIDSPKFNTKQEAESYKKELVDDSIKRNKEKLKEVQEFKNTEKPTQHYSNLTVPGGTNYTENEISTPDITPNIKGHAQFSTDNGIGWFRSDDKIKEGTQSGSLFWGVADGETGEIQDSFDDEEKAKEYAEQLNRNLDEFTPPYFVSLNRKYGGKNTITGEATKTRRVLEVQSDLFQKGRDKKDLIKKQGDILGDSDYLFKHTDGKYYKISNWNNLGLDSIQEAFDYNYAIEITKEEYESKDGSKENPSKNQFLQLLNQKNNWVTFFVKSIIQDSAKKGYEKVLFPKGDTAARIEGHQTLEEFKKQKRDRIKELEKEKNIEKGVYKLPENSKVLYNGSYVEVDKLVVKSNDKIIYKKGFKTIGETYSDDAMLVLDEFNVSYKLAGDIRASKKIEINQLKQEIADVESGKTKLSSIASFYENTIANILNKNNYSPVEVVDEYGNAWNDVTITPEVLSDILLQKDEADNIIGQANIKAMTVLIDAVNQKQDTLPHEYAHHYIAWNRETPLVKEAIKKWGSEEALVQAIGEQVVMQKGEAWDWWNKFTKWLTGLFSNVSELDKEQLKNILTDAFIERRDITPKKSVQGEKESQSKAQENKSDQPKTKVLPNGKVIKIRKISQNEGDEGYDMPMERSALEAIQKDINTTLLIPGLTTARQQTLIDNVAMGINAAVIETGEMSIDEAFTEWYDTFESLQEAHEEYGNIVQVNDLEQVLNNWEMFKDLTMDYLSQFSTLKITEDLGDEVEEEENGGDLSSTNWGDEGSLMINGKDTISVKLKKFFANIKDVDVQGNVKENYVLLDKYVPFDVVYNTLSAKLGGDGAEFSKADFGVMMKTLEESSNAIPFLKDVIIKLQKADRQIQNEFVVAMAKHYVRMKYVLWEGNSTDGYSLQVNDTNQNSIARTIEKNWINNINVSDLFIEKDENIVINEEIGDAMIELYNNWVSEKTIPNVEELQDWLSLLGIELSPQTIEQLYKRGIYINGKKQVGVNILEKKTGFVGILAGKIETHLSKSREGDPVTLADLNPISDNSISSLAKLESRYVKNVLSNSHKDGEGKTVFSYTQNKYAMSRYRDLIKNKQLIEDLKQIPFTKNSKWINELSGDTVMKEVHEVTYMDTIRRKDRKGKGKKLKNMSKAEHELTKLAFLQNKGITRKGVGGDKTRIGRFMYPTMSDKSTMLVVQSVLNNTKLLSTGSIHPETIDAVYDALVIPEINRILAHQNEPIDTIKNYDKGARMFFFLPEINNEEVIWETLTFEDGSEQRFLKDDILLEKEYVSALKSVVKNYLESAINDKLAEWETMGITEASPKFMDKNYYKLAGEMAPSFKLRFAALDFVSNYMIANANIFQAYIGDPALFYKKEKKTNSTDHVGISQDTFINIGKRLAGDIAPGYEVANSETDTYTQGFISDRESESVAMDHYKELLDTFSSYESIEGTDAQEFTTWAEHLDVMFNIGKISDRDYNTISSILLKGEFLSSRMLGIIMQPMKPVYVNNIIEYGKNGNPITERRMYIKSSSFPLIPQLTANLEIDKLRKAMEKENVDRVAFGTAVKVGNFSNTPQFFEKDGSRYVGKENFSFGDAVKTLPRTGFRIQQEVPYDASKEKINDGTQQRKLLFSNILETEEFVYEDKSHTGKELKEKYDDLYKQLFQNDLKELRSKLGIKNNKPNWKKVQKILQEEAKKRNYPINDILALEIGEDGNFTVPIWASTSAGKFEALLNSLVDGDVRKKKTRGNSFVLGTEEGFQSIKEGDEGQRLIGEHSDIIFTENWDGYLKPQRIEDGKVKPAQILIPNRIKDQRGNNISLIKYVNKSTGLLDTSKIDPDLLKMFGFRIPTQGLNSMAYMEVVGFLPESMGDLLIAPRDWTIQMGSDFDIDKLYAYMYNSYEEKGHVKKYKKGDLKTDKENLYLQNELLDIHFSVLSNSDSTVQKQIAKPLDFGDLKDGKDLAATIDNIRRKRERFNPLGPTYQRDKFMNATAGKAGVGNFSNDSTFNALTQDKDLVLGDTVYVKGRPIFNPLTVKFGKDISNGDLSNPFTLASKRNKNKKYKSDVIAAYQSAAVDNEKEQILDKININSYTFDVIKVLNQLGFEEDVVAAFISQDIIFDYVNEITKLKDSTNEARVKNAQVEAIKNITEKYEGFKPSGSESYNESMSSKADIGADDLLQKIKDGGKSDPNTQIAILYKFVALSEYGKKIKGIQSTINTDSAGIGKTLFYSSVKEEQIAKLQKNKFVQNAHKLIGEYSSKPDVGYEPVKTETGKYIYVKPTTIAGFASIYALTTNNRLWEGAFPYQTKSVRSQLTEIEELLNAEDVTLQEAADMRSTIWNDMKSFLFTNVATGLYSTNDLLERRKELFFDEYENITYEKQNEVGATIKYTQTVLKKPSLASRVKEALGKRELAVNPFLNKLSLEINKNAPSLIKFTASSGENFDEKNNYIGFTELIVNERSINPDYTTRNLASDLIEYAYLEGGIQAAVQFVKFVPNAYLKHIPFAKTLKELDFRNLGLFGIQDRSYNYYDTSRFTDQYMQHNTWRAVGIDNKELSKYFKAPSSFNKSQYKNTTELIPIMSNEWEQFLVTNREQSGEKLDVAYPEYFTINHSEGIMLFKFNGDVYERLDTLGTFGMSEYDFNTNIAFSNIKKQQANRQTITSESNLLLDKSNKIKNTKPIEETQKLKSSFLTDVATGLAEIATKSKSDNHKRLAEFLMNNLNADISVELLSEIPLKKGNTKREDGKWKVRIWEKAHGGKTDLERTILHELMHVLTVDGIKKNPKLATELNNIINRTINALPSAKQSEIRKLIASNDKSKLLTENVYGLYNNNELIAEAFTNPEFQKILKEIPYKEDKSLWQKLMDKLAEMFESIFGEKIQPNALSSVFDITIKIIEQEQSSNRIFSKIKRAPGNFNPNIGPSGHINLPLLNQEINMKGFQDFLKRKNIC